MSKRGQLTIPLVGIALIILIFLLAFYFSAPRSVITTPADAGNIQQFVESCLTQVSSEGLLLLGMQGGYTVAPEFPPSTTLGDYEPVYAYYRGFDLLPSRSDIMNYQLGPSVASSLPGCTNNFEEFQGIEITAGVPTISGAINDNSVSVDLTYPLTITQGSQTQLLQDFSVEIPSRLGAMHDIARLLVKKQVEDPNWVDVTLLADIEEFDVVYSPQSPTEAYYVITDSSVPLLGKNYTFMVPIRFDENHPPTVFSIPDQELAVGETLVYRVNAEDDEGETLTYSDDSELFDIDPKTGVIEHTVMPQDIGEHFITITVTDQEGNEEQEKFKLRCVG